MNDQELFELRKKKILTFGNPVDLTAFLDRLIVEEVRFPLVVGYERFDPQEWKVINLSPQTTDDRLTVENYLSGLRAFTQLWKSSSTEAGLLAPNFSGILVYEGIERVNPDQRFLSFGIGFMNSDRNRDFMHYGINLQNQGQGYTASTERHKTDLDKIMAAHLGPK